MACFLAPMATAVAITAIRRKFSLKWHINWLISMLWGGVIMLAVEHIAHGEIVLYPPFLTKGLDEVLPEILKLGVPMSLLVFIVWLAMVGIANWLEKIKKVSFVNT